MYKYILYTHTYIIDIRIRTYVYAYAYTSNMHTNIHTNTCIHSYTNTYIYSVVSKCNAMLETRQPMQMQTFKPEPVKAIAPLFTEDYKWSKDSTDPDKERTEMKKLKRKVQRERKGAARELRKDGAYLAQVRDTNRQEKLDDMRSQRKRNMASLDDESALYNAAVRFGAEIKGGGTASIDRKGKRKM